MEEDLEEYYEDSNGYEDYQDSLDGLPPPAEEEVYDLSESKVKRKKLLGAFWKKPPTKVYADNFGFGINGYQPMIDYLDVKDSGGSVDKSEVHLPFLEERCMNKYSSQKKYKNYDNKEIDKYIAKGEKIRTQIRQNDAAGASNVHRRTHTNWSMTKKSVQLVKNSYVIDYRNLHSNDNQDEGESVPNYSVPPVRPHTQSKYTIASLIPKILDMESSGILSSYVRNRLDHDNDMAARRERLRALDDQYEENLKKLSYTVDRISKRAESLPRIISPHGRTYCPQDMIDVADELIYSNRMKRQQDLYRMASNVNALTDSNVNRYRPDIAPRFSDDDIFRVNPTIIAIAKRNAEAAQLPRNINHYISGSHEDKDADELRQRYLNQHPAEETELLPAPRRPKKVYDDIISDVQTRILSRAREMGGVSAESRRISNRARYVNTCSPRPNTDDVDLRVPPSLTERNITQMAKSLAYSGKAIRRYDVDDEVDAPVSNLNTNMTKLYCTRESQPPVPEVPSDSIRVRNAAIKARTRNTLLGY